MSAMTGFDVHANDMTGSLPPGWSNMTSMYNFYVSENPRMSGLVRSQALSSA